MAKKIPVSICIIKHNPSNEPNFHHIDKLDGKGKSTNVPFRIRKIGCSFRNGPVIICKAYI